MAEASKPVLQKPPGYRDPNTPRASAPKPPIRKPALHPSFYPKPKRKSCYPLCCCYFCVLIFIVLFLLVVAGALFYLWFEPKLPIFYLQSLKIPKFKISVKPDGTYLDSQTVVRFEARNPNSKLKFYYGRTRVRMTVGDDVDLGSASRAGFTQGKKNTTVLKFGTQEKSTLIDDDAGTKLKARFRSKQLVVSIEVRTSFGLGVGKWKLGMVAVKVLCGDVNWKKLEGGATHKCTINLLKWINLH